MARARKKVRVRVVAQPVIDATPERLGKGDDFDFINPAKIDSSEQPIGLTRRFRSTHLDRLYRKDDPERSRLTHRQYAAGDWYRSQHARCSFAMAVISSYGERTSAGEPSYGLPRSEAQARARQVWRTARSRFSIGMVGFMDRFLIHDELPRYGGSAAMRNIQQIQRALDDLADWLQLN